MSFHAEGRDVAVCAGRDVSPGAVVLHLPLLEKRYDAERRGWLHRILRLWCLGVCRWGWDDPGETINRGCKWKITGYTMDYNGILIVIEWDINV